MFRIILIGALVVFTTCPTPVRMLLIRTDTQRSTTVSSTDDHVLNGSAIYKQRTSDFLSCAQSCLAHPNCMSFNYENIENGVCELNRDATDGSILVALTTRIGYTFGQFLNITVSIDRLLCHLNCNHRDSGFFPLTIQLNDRMSSPGNIFEIEDNFKLKVAL